MSAGGTPSGGPSSPHQHHQRSPRSESHFQAHGETTTTNTLTTDSGRTVNPPSTSTPSQPPTSSSSPYTRVYNAASYAAAHAASPILGYLSNATTTFSGTDHPYSPSPHPPAVPGRRNSSNSSSSRPTAMTPAGSTSPILPPGNPPFSRSSSGTAPSQQVGQAGTATGSSVSGTPPGGTAGTRRGMSQDDEAKRKESRNLDSIVSQFFNKAAQVITQARFTHVQTTTNDGPGLTRESGTQQRGGAPTGKKSRNRWFNLEVEEGDTFKEELRTWRSVTSLLSPSSAASSASSLSASASRALSANYASVPSMIMDVILDVSDLSGNQVLVLNDSQGRRTRIDLSDTRRNPSSDPSALQTTPKKCNIVLERWTVSLRPSTASTSPELPAVYKHCIILFRALYTLVRALPAYELHRKQKRRAALGTSDLKIGCRLSTGDANGSAESSQGGVSMEENSSEIGLDEPLADDNQTNFQLQDFAFAPIVTPIGTLDFRCKYRSSVDFSVEEIEALLSSRFIDEDFFKPTMRKYSSSSGAGVVPIRGSSTSPVVSHSAQQAEHQRPSYGSLSSRHPPTGSSQQDHPITQPEEGAFVTLGRARGASTTSRMSADDSPALSRRPSVGTSHPFKPASPSTSPAPRSYVAQPPSTTHPQSSLVRLSSSPASASGPSSSLRYSYGRAPSTSGSPGPPVISSQLSYTKKAVPSPSAATSPPVSGLSAMNISSSPSNNSSSNYASTAQPLPVPGTSASSIPPPLSSSPTPSMIKRYSSPRFSRSFGQGSSGSSPGDAQGYFESLGRRSRLSSVHSRDEALHGTSHGSGGAMSAAPPTRQQGSLPIAMASPVEQQHQPQARYSQASDSDDIKSFLGLIDSRVQLHQGSPASASGFLRRSTVFSRASAEEKLKSLADSVYRDKDISPPSSLGRHSVARPPSLEQSPSLPAVLAPRQSPSPDHYSGSPGNSAAANSISPSAGSGSSINVRARASQAPMAGSIPEEDPHSLSQIHRYSRPSSHTGPAVQDPSGPGSNPSSVTGSGNHFPFPRYISNSSRRRGSGNSASPRPSFSGSPNLHQGSPSSLGQQPTTTSTTAEHPSSSQQQGSSASFEHPAVAGYETGEEQTMGQLDLSTEQEQEATQPPPHLHSIGSHHHFSWNQ